MCISQRICDNCIKDKYMKRFISENGSIGNCLICEAEKITCDIADKGFSTMLKSSIRYHYTERVYNSHWGGYSDWLDIFTSENEIFNFIMPDRYYSNNKYELVYDVFDQIEGHISDYSTDVSLYYGGARLEHYAMSVELDYSYKVLEIKQNLDSINYQFLINKFNDVMKPVLNRVKTSIHKDGYYRARIGIKEHLFDPESAYFEQVDKVFIPYIWKEIGEPPMKISAEGRLNRKGSSFLYLATDKQTAISEVKPSTGQYLSIGKFKFRENKDGWEIADFANLDFYDFSSSDEDIERFVILNSIKKELSIPNPDRDYRFTQLISDVLILNGFHGILFTSSVSDGQNLVVFQPINMEYISLSHEVVEIKKILVNYNELPCEMKAGIEYVNTDGMPFEDGTLYYKNDRKY